MGQERIWTLLSRKLANEAGEAEIEELDILLVHNHPELNDIVQQIIEHWERPVPGDSEFMEATYLLHLEKMIQKGIPFSSPAQENQFGVRLSVSQKRKRNILLLTVPLCLLAVLFFIYLGYTHSSVVSKEDVAYAKDRKEIVTENGTRTKTILPDGSVVWLNAGSKITYEGNLSGPTREIKLEGEAFFDVAKQPEHPFIVHAGNIDIKALGTAFDVRSYSSDKTIEATLLRGIIEITRQDDNSLKGIVLHPNQKVILDRDIDQTKLRGSTYGISKIDMVNEKDLPETSWIFNRLSFKDDDFETLATKMERWYNIKIVFQDDAIKKIHFNGSFENETVEQAFSALQMASSFTYKINGNEIYINSLSN